MTPKLRNTRKCIGRGAMYTGRSHTERGGGLYRRENAGISSERGARNSPVESLRFSGEGSSTRSKSGPKQRPKGVCDGQQVDIPVLPRKLMKQCHGKIEETRGWKCASKQ